jgi:ferrous iron transport protein A
MECNNESDDQHNGHQKLRRWGFTFFGETPTTGQEEDALAEIPNDSATEVYFSLAMATVGDRVRIVRLIGKGITSRLLSLGLTPGTELIIVSRAPTGSVVVAFQNNHIGLGVSMAQKIMVTDARNRVSTSSETKPLNMNTNTHLRNLAVGCRGRIVGYEHVTGGYKGRLLAMGLTPGTEFTLIGHDPLDDLIEIEVQGVKLSLRKHEADVLCIEEINED